MVENIKFALPALQKWLGRARSVRVPITCVARLHLERARVIAEKDVRRGQHAIKSAGDAVQPPNKRALNVLHPRLHKELLRVTAGDYVLSTTVARVVALRPHLNRVRTTCTTRGYPCTKVLSRSKLLPQPHRVQISSRVCALVIHVCFAFYSLAISV